MLSQQCDSALETLQRNRCQCRWPRVRSPAEPRHPVKPPYVGFLNLGKWLRPIHSVLLTLVPSSVQENQNAKARERMKR